MAWKRLHWANRRLRHAAPGLEESKQVLYLLKLRWAVVNRRWLNVWKPWLNALNLLHQGSPVNESPLGLFNAEEDGAILEEDYGIPRRYLKTVMSPWAVKRLHEFGGDITRFRVVKRYPSRLNQLAVSKNEPGDENNQDISSLVGKVDIRKLEDYPQNDTDAYSYSGGLCLSIKVWWNSWEMFKAPIKVLHPLLTATQEGNYNGTESIGAIPFSGWFWRIPTSLNGKPLKITVTTRRLSTAFRLWKCHYCLRVTEEIKIYDKLLFNSSLAAASCAPDTLKLLAQFIVLSRLKEPENSNLFSKMRIYDGENLKDIDPKAKAPSNCTSGSRYC